MNHLRSNSLLLITFVVSLLFSVPGIIFAFDGYQIIFKILFVMVTNITGMFFWVGGMILDAGFNIFVINFAHYYNGTGFGFAVNNIWITVRDFVNMLFIFGLLYIGFKMILDSDDSNTRRWLASLIMAALLINFSLFITKFVIDVSNQLATEIAIQGFGAELDQDTGLRNIEISKIFMVKSGYVGILGRDNIPQQDQVGFFYIVGVGLIYMVGGFVFAAGGILLMIRFAVLNLFMIMSPLMFLSWIIPAFSNVTQRYWRAFLGRAFFAPVYIFFLYISLSVLDQLRKSLPNIGPSTGVFQPPTSGTNGMDTTLPFFIMIIIFMVASLVVGSKLGVEGGGKAVDMGKRLARYGGKVAANNTLGIGARGVARASESASRAYNRLDSKLGNSSGGRAARTVMRGAAAVGSLGLVTDKNIRATLATGKNTSVLGSETIEQQRNREAGYYQANQGAQNTRDIRAGLEAQTEREAIENAAQADGRPLSQAETETIKKLEENIIKTESLAAKLSVKEFEEFSDADQVQIAPFLSSSQTEGILKSDKTSDKQKNAITDKQKAAIRNKILENGEIVTDDLVNLTLDQLETLGADFITQNAHLLSNEQFDNLKKSKKFSDTQKGRFIGERKAQSIKAVTSGNASSIFKVKKRGSNTPVRRKSVDISKMSGDVLADPNSTQYLNADVLKAIASNDREFARVTSKQRREIFKNVETAGSAEDADQELVYAWEYLLSSKAQRDFFGTGE